MDGGDGRGELDGLRGRLDEINAAVLRLLCERGRIVARVRDLKERSGAEMFNPAREREMLDALVAANEGPFPDAVVRHLFKEVFRASLAMMERSGVEALRVARGSGPEVVVRVGDRAIGGERPVLIAGPCAVEDEEQVRTVAHALAAMGVEFLRGGAFKPRTSPYAFQGLGEEGLRMLSEAGREAGLATVSEVVDTRTVEVVARYVDVLQVGSRNMANYELLKAVAVAGKPVLLKRGFAATLDEFLQAAEYLALAGNEQIVLCERGIRTFERETRYTLDLAAVPLLRRMSRLPVVVDASHAAGRRDILPALSRAAFAAGADGLMLEVHPRPEVARSDSQQQLDLPSFAALATELEPLRCRRYPAPCAGGGAP
ncbi:MAG: bifunctional 3-deoxy-7-phosphoheptulonate synthase/chorismate mutase [Deltaproteobacteria bacterium]|nr:bifunctional 3-deoxy-7-phosphoheptulonate synthase/chorismate mutase [Deltaproteobacteria bacterium]